VDVPPPVAGVASRHPAALFYRVLATDPQTIRVELWERGEFHGARKVSLAQGTAQILARRIALAAAELARRLRRKRLAEAAQPKKDPNLDSAGAGVDQARVAFGAGAGAVLLGPGDAMLLGPQLGAELRFASGARLGLGSAWLLGSAVGLDGSPPMEWLELSLSPSYALKLTRGLELALGAGFAAASLHVNDVAAVDGIDGQEQSWSARAALELLLEARLGHGLGLRAGSDAGVVLRRIPVQDAGGGKDRLGGLWLGGSLGLFFDPAAR
jgi:hypothetical protein